MNSQKMFRNRKGTSIKGIIIMIVMFGLLTTIGINFYSDMFNSYREISGLQTSKTFNATLNQINQTNVLVEQMSSNLINASASPSGSVFTAIYEGGYSVLKLAFNSLLIIRTIIETVAGEIGIPPYIIVAFIVIVTIVLTTLILGLIFNRLIV